MQLTAEQFSVAFSSLATKSVVELEELALSVIQSDGLAFEFSVLPKPDQFTQYFETSLLPRLKSEVGRSVEAAKILAEITKREYPAVVPSTIFSLSKFICASTHDHKSPSVEAIVALSCIVLGIALKARREARTE